MKKILAMAAVAMMTAMNVNAQSAGEWTFKTRVGGNLSTVSNNDDAKWKADWSVALGVDYMITDKLAATLELQRDIMGSKSEMTDKKSTLDYLHFPLMAKYYVTKWLALQAGPQIGFLLRAKNDGVSYKDQCKKTEFSIPVGASVEIPVTSSWKSHVLVDLRYHLGLTKVNDYDTDSYCNRGFIMTVGYKYDF